MKIISYNVNGLRAAVGKNLQQWIKDEQPDVLCIQEIKLQPDQFPHAVFEEIGYKSYFACAQKKGYSGVAIITRIEPEHVEYGMGIEKYDNEGRFIRADFPGGISVASIYHPSGTSGEIRQAFKMQWLDDFHKYAKKLSKTHPKLMLCGDYNIAHNEIDIHDPVSNRKNSGFLPEEREWMSKFLADEYYDTFRMIHPESQTYSWWTYRFQARTNNKGWRIDYCMASKTLKPLVTGASILTDVIHSDHCPVVVEIK